MLCVCPYDGHGSTRQLVADNEDVTDAFSYDGYGMMLGGNPTRTNPAATSLLYTGEHLDNDAQQYYLRARYYDTSTGRFNRPDPFSGNHRDPQSLHKYLYAHCNPTNGLDPSGESFILEFTIQTAIRAAIAAALFGTISFTSAKLKGATWVQALWYGLRTAAITGFAFISPLFAWSLAIVTPILIGLGIYSGDITKKDVPEFAAYVAAAIVLILLFKTTQYTSWEAKTELKINMRTAARNLKMGHSIRPGRDLKWTRAVRSGNKTAQGSLFHGEVADLMRAENMTNLGVEVSYNQFGDIVNYGTKGSIRLDYSVYHNGSLIKVFDLKPTDVINGSRMNEMCNYSKLSPKDIEALSYRGKL